MSTSRWLVLASRAHALLYRLTGGRVGRYLGSLEQVLLTTRGRRSGRARTVPLTVLARGETLVLVASNGGSPEHPQWYRNLLAEPRVIIQRGGARRHYLARTAREDERAVLWPQVVAAYRGYAAYQRRTERRTPLVVCDTTFHDAGPAHLT